MQSRMSATGVSDVHSFGESDAKERKLAAECVVFARYLIGYDCPAVIIRRYVVANALLLDGADDGVVAFALRHPWALPYLDAACGLRLRDGVLRRKLVLLTAILEATTEFADVFLPEPVGRVGFLFWAFRHGVTAFLKGVLGLLLLPFAEAHS